ncbi:MAG: hypothetical protein RLZZ435_3575, partial [Cyanobacteriota bacterium]
KTISMLYVPYHLIFLVTDRSIDSKARGLEIQNLSLQDIK